MTLNIDCYNSSFDDKTYKIPYKLHLFHGEMEQHKCDLGIRLKVTAERTLPFN